MNCTIKFLYINQHGNLYKKCAEYSLFGAAAKLPKRQISTNEDVFKGYCWSLKTNDTEPKLMFKRVKMLAIEVMFIQKRVFHLLIYRVLQFCKLEQHPKLKRTSAEFNDNCSFEKLFDFSTCKCWRCWSVNVGDAGV